MPISYPYTQYGGIWKLSAASAAQGAGTWAVPPQPHLLSWGGNSTGRLGLGNTTDYSSPKQVGSLTTWANLEAGYYSVLATRSDGTLWSWGQNNYGQLGLGNTTNYSSPKQVGALTTWLNISSGAYHCVAIKTDGTLWAWGYNNRGQLGQSNVTNYSSPKQIGSLTTWSKVTAGAYHSAAIKTDGTLWTWGNNVNFNATIVFGCLGLGTAASYSSPKQVGSLTDWLTIVGGGYQLYASKTDGSIWSWGYNANGQLGLNVSTYAFSSPKQIGTLTTWSKIGKNSNGPKVTKTDGTLWAWGLNSSGELGLGNRTTYSSPKQIGSLTTWISAFSGQSTVALKTDGTLWVWGLGTSGQLGLGNTTSYSSPVQVGSLTSWQAVFFGNAIGNGNFAIAKT